jgi:hypothetical protein
VLVVGKLPNPASSTEVSAVTVPEGSVIVNVVVTASEVSSFGVPHPPVLFRAS